MGRHFVWILGWDLLGSSNKDCVHCYCWKKVPAAGVVVVVVECSTLCVCSSCLSNFPPTDGPLLLLLPFGCYNMDLNLNRNGPQHGIDSHVPRKPKDKYKHTRRGSLPRFNEVLIWASLSVTITFAHRSSLMLLADQIFNSFPISNWCRSFSVSRCLSSPSISPSAPSAPSPCTPPKSA